MYFFLFLVLKCKLLESKDGFWGFLIVFDFFFFLTFFRVADINWKIPLSSQTLSPCPSHWIDWQRPYSQFPGLAAAKSDCLIQFCPLRYKWKSADRNDLLSDKRGITSSFLVLGTWMCKYNVLSFSSHFVIRRHEHEGNKKPTCLYWQLYHVWNYLHSNFFSLN